MPGYISVATGGQLGAIAPPTVIRSTPEIRANPKSLGGGVGKGIKGKLKVTKVTKIIDSYSCKYILDAHCRGHRDAVILCTYVICCNAVISLAHCISAAPALQIVVYS